MASSMERTILAQDQQLASYRARARKAIDNNRRQINDAMEAASTVLVSGGFGYFEGRYPDRSKVMGVPLSAVVGGGIVLGALAGVIPDDPYVVGAGAGALAAWAYKAGNDRGIAAASAA